MAREQEFIDQSALSGNIVGVSSYQFSAVVPAFPHQPGRQALILIAWAPVLGGTLLTDVLVDAEPAMLVQLVDNTTCAAAIYRFPNTPTGSFDVDLIWDGSVNGNAALYLLEQVDMAAPVKASNVNSGTGTSSAIALGTVELEELAFSVIAVFAGTNTTGCSSTAPLNADQNTLAGASPLRLRGVEANASGSGGSITATHTPAASKPFAHAACVMRAANIVPLRGLVGTGI